MTSDNPNPKAARAARRAEVTRSLATLDEYGGAEPGEREACERELELLGELDAVDFFLEREQKAHEATAAELDALQRRYDAQSAALRSKTEEADRWRLRHADLRRALATEGKKSVQLQDVDAVEQFLRTSHHAAERAESEREHARKVSLAGRVEALCDERAKLRTDLNAARDEAFDLREALEVKFDAYDARIARALRAVARLRRERRHLRACNLTLGDARLSLQAALDDAHGRLARSLLSRSVEPAQAEQPSPGAPGDHSPAVHVPPEQWPTCPQCAGRGWFRNPRYNDPAADERCRLCGGYGRVEPPRRVALPTRAAAPLPKLGASCECGHAFGAHEKRQGFWQCDAPGCECGSFRYPEQSTSPTVPRGTALDALAGARPVSAAEAFSTAQPASTDAPSPRGARPVSPEQGVKRAGGRAVSTAQTGRSTSTQGARVVRAQKGSNKREEVSGKAVGRESRGESGCAGRILPSQNKRSRKEGPRRR